MRTFKRPMEPEYDTPMMKLPFDDGDEVYAYDFADGVMFKATVIFVSVRKKAEHKAVFVKMEDSDGVIYHRAIDKTCFVAKTERELKTKLVDRLAKAQKDILSADFTKTTKHLIPVL